MIKKNISKILISSIMLNNIYFISNASTVNDSIPNRYQTLEGELVTITDSTEGIIEDVEILGNTIQNDNNLEDIQSSGELYVDKYGNPILDSQKKEQYLININNTNTHGYYHINNEYNDENIELVYGHGREHYFGKDNIRVIYKSTSISRTDFNISGLIPNTTYRITGQLQLLTDNNEAIFNIKNGSNVLVLYGGTKYTQVKITSPIQNISLTATSTPDGILKLCFFNVYLTSSGASFNGEVSLNNILLAKDIGAINDLNTAQLHNNAKIVLPSQLEGIKGENFRYGYRDRLYYDNSKRRYILEKGINEVVKKTSDIDESHFSINTTSENGYFNLMIPASLFANDIKRYSVVMINNFDFGKNKDYTVFLTDSHHLHFHIPVEDLEEDTLECAISKWKEVIGDFFRLKYVSNSPKTIETNITSKLKIASYEDKTYLYSTYKNSINPILKATVDRLPQIAKNATADAVSTTNSNNVALARMYVNMLIDSAYKDQLQEQLNNLFSEDMVLEKYNATANLDVYIKSENILSMALDTNTVTFENFSGVEELEEKGAISITIHSSLPYSLNAYLPTEMKNSDGTKILDKNILNIKENNENNYKKFLNLNEKVVLKDNCNKGNNISHLIDLKLSSDESHDADVYKTTIKFEAEQK